MGDDLFKFRIQSHFRTVLTHGFYNSQFQGPLLAFLGILRCGLMTAALHYVKNTRCESLFVKEKSHYSSTQGGHLFPLALPFLLQFSAQHRPKLHFHHSQTTLPDGHFLTGEMAWTSRVLGCSISISITRNSVPLSESLALKIQAMYERMVLR